jgi:hypothetical protein
VSRRTRRRRSRTLWLWGGLVVALAGTIAVTAIARTMQPDSAPACRSALIPAYLPPAGLEQLAERPVGGRLVVFNPANGPGAVAEPAYREAVAALRRSGTRVLGYVHTSYGARPRADVHADIGRYRDWYGVDGVFLDETPRTEEQLPYYRALAQDARGIGEKLVVLNPGAVPARGYFDVADVIVTFEGPYAAYAPALRRMPGWVRTLAARRVAHLVYGASDTDARLAVDELSGAGFVYATSGALPDPWSALPAYLDDLERRLAACA